MEALSGQDQFTSESIVTANAVHPAVMTDQAGLIILVNDMAQALLPAAEIQPTHITELFDSSVRRFVERLWELAFSSESDQRHPEAVLPLAGENGRWRVVVVPLQTVTGDVAGLNWHVEPLPARDGLEYEPLAWLEFLSGASPALHASLDLKVTLQSVVSTCVPLMADWCTVDLVSTGDSYLRRAAVFHVDPEKAKAVFAMRRRYPIAQPDDHPIVDVVNTGIPVVISQFNDDRLSAMTRDRKHRSFIDSLGIRSSMILPLHAPEGIIGAMTFSTAESGRSYTDGDLTRAMQYAERAAQAVSNARTHQHAVQLSRIREHYLSVASHELRTPLAVVGGFATLLIRQMERPDSDRETVDMLAGELQRGVDRLEALTEDLLVVSTLQQTSQMTDVESMDLIELLHTVVERLSVVHPEAKGKIRIFGDERVNGRWNPGLLDRAFSNLISNAVKYSPHTVDIRVSVRTDEHGFVSVDIADSGIGISEDEQETLFLPFTRGGNARRISDGTGLGLYITLQIIEQHQGTVDVQSTPGEGTTFSVHIPRQLQASSEV